MLGFYYTLNVASWVFRRINNFSTTRLNSLCLKHLITSQARLLPQIVDEPELFKLSVMVKMVHWFLVMVHRSPGEVWLEPLPEHSGSRRCYNSEKGHEEFEYTYVFWRKSILCFQNKFQQYNTDACEVILWANSHTNHLYFKKVCRFILS